MPPRSRPYSAYARHYNRIGQSYFGTASAMHLLRLLHSRGESPRSVLDLACGTGSATLEFAKHGLSATGLDLSPDMLAIARRLAEDAGVDVSLIEADMTDFILSEQVNLCASFYDSVNYLADQHGLCAFARCSFRALKPGGYLAFDINTRRKLQEHWGEGTIIAADSDDLFIMYRTWFDASSDSSPLIITGFERQADGSWLRFDEEHIEYAFAIEEMVATLIGAGFEQPSVIDWREASPGDFLPGSEHSNRVLFLARKPLDRGIIE